jgi:hypothetical protein
MKNFWKEGKKILCAMVTKADREKRIPRGKRKRITR